MGNDKLKQELIQNFESLNGMLFERSFIYGFLKFLKEKLHNKNLNFSHNQKSDKLKKIFYIPNKAKIIEYIKELIIEFKELNELYNQYSNKNIIQNTNENKIEKIIFELYLVIIKQKEFTNEINLNINKDILESNIKYIISSGMQEGKQFGKNLIKYLEKEENNDIYFPYYIKTIYFTSGELLKELKKIIGKPEKNNIDFEYIEKFFPEMSFEYIENIKVNDYYLEKGNFLNSDLLIHIKNYNENNDNYNNKIEFLINCELSFHNKFLISIFTDNKNKSKEYIKVMSKQNNLYLNKNVLEYLNVEENNIENSLREGILHSSDKFYVLLSYDKELIKLLQSMANMKSYVDYLNKNVNPKNKNNIITFSKIFAITNVDMNSYNINENLKNNNKLKSNNEIFNYYNNISLLLEKQEKIYKESLDESLNNKNSEENKLNNLKEIANASGIHYLLDAENNKLNFLHNENSFKKLQEFLFKPELNKELKTTFIENIKIKNITSIENRKKHTEKFINLLETVDIIYPIGAPGIGKTTSAIGYLTKLDNFVFIYSASRTAVNEDIIDKINNDPKNIFNKDEKFMKEWEKTNVVFTVNSFLTSNNSILINKKETKDLLNDRNEKNGSFRKYVNSLKEINKKNDNNNNIENMTDTHSFYTDTKNNETVFQSISSTFSEIIENDKNINKITGTFAIQGYTENTFNELFKFLITMDKKNKINNLVIMLDEITGDSGSINFIDSLLKFFYVVENDKPIKRKRNTINDIEIDLESINLKLIIADASLSNKEVLIKYLRDKFDISKIYMENINNLEENEDTINVEYLNTTNTLKKELFYGPVKSQNNSAAILNINSFPAKSLNLKFSLIQEFENFDSERYIEKIERKNIKIIKNIIKEWLNNLSENNDYGILFFLQDKRLMEEIIELIRKDENLKNQLEQFFKKSLNEIILIINNETVKTDEKRNEIMNNKENYNIYFVTSTASRGISFKKLNKLVIYIPPFEIESQLNEIIQVIYRGRGNHVIDENIEKELEFIIPNYIYFNENEIIEEKNKIFIDIFKNYLNIYNIIYLIKSVIMTRIDGKYVDNTNKIRVVPNGLKGKIEQKNNEITNLKNSIDDLGKIKKYGKLRKTLYGFLNNSIEHESKLKTKININLHKLLNKISINDLISGTIRFEKEDYFMQIDYDSNYIIIKDRILLNIYSKKENIENFKEFYKEFKTMINEEKDIVYKGKLEKIDETLKIFFQFDNEHNIRNDKLIEGYFVIPLYYLILFHNEKITIDEEILKNFNYISIFARNKFLADTKSMFPFNDKTEFLNNIPFIFMTKHQYELFTEKKFKNKYISNNSLFNSLNISHMKKF